MCTNCDMACSKLSRGYAIEIGITCSVVMLLLTIIIIITQQIPTNPFFPTPLMALTPEQLVLLSKIKVEAEKAGFGERELENIDKIEQSVCYDIDCLESALEIMGATNLEENPCDPSKWLDFVCSRRLVQGADILAQGAQFENQARENTLLLLRENTTDSSEFLLAEAKTYFGQCINKGDHDEQDVLDILEYSKRYGGWPVKTSSPIGGREDYYPWMDYVAEQNRLRAQGFIPMFLAVDVAVSGNGTRMVMDVGRTSSFDEGQRTAGKYAEVIKRLASKGNLNQISALDQLKEAFESLGHLDQALRSAFFGYDDSNSGKYFDREELTLEQLQAVTDQHLLGKGIPTRRIDWSRFFERVLTGTGISLGGDGEDSIQYISVPLFPVLTILEKVELLMSSGGDRHHRGIVSALHLNTIWMLLKETTFLAEDLPPYLVEDKSQSSRMNTCLGRTTKLFGYSLGKTYLNRFYNKSLEEPQIHHLLETIKQGFLELIESPPWTMGNSSLAHSTKHFLQSRVKGIELHIGGPKWIKEQGQLEKYFEGLRISPKSSHVHNFLEATRWEVSKTREWKSRLLSAIQNKEITAFESLPNFYLGLAGAFYLVPSNTISLLAASIQPPVFGANRPGFINYAGLGTMLAHEVAHSISVIDGRKQLGEDNSEHWDPTDFLLFKSWISDIARFYDSIPVQLNNNGQSQFLSSTEDSTAEDIADVLGLHAAFLAYENYLVDLSRAGQEERVLPGLSSFSPQQLFFMKYGNMLCESPSVQVVVFESLAKNAHSASSRRADIPLRLSEHFKNSFHCN